MLLRNMSILKKNKYKFIFPMKFLQKRKDELYENTMKKNEFLFAWKNSRPINWEVHFVFSTFFSLRPRPSTKQIFSSAPFFFFEKKKQREWVEKMRSAFGLKGKNAHPSASFFFECIFFFEKRKRENGWKKIERTAFMHKVHPKEKKSDEIYKNFLTDRKCIHKKTQLYFLIKRNQEKKFFLLVSFY